MDIYTILLSFIFGVVIGSFLNVVSLRFNTGVGIGGRSRCMSCGTTLTWRELIPLLSFFAQRGSCKTCKTKISWQYPLVEFVAGILFVLTVMMFPPISTVAAVTTVFMLVILALLLVIVAYDIKHKIIPDRFSYVFAVIAFLNLWIGGSVWWQIPEWGALLAGPVLALPFALLWLVSRGSWMGLGDAKLMLGIGWMLGIDRGINAIVLAFWIAAIVSVAWIMFSRKKYKPKTEIPFGPYLIMGMYIVLFSGLQVIDIGLAREIISLWI